MKIEELIEKWEEHKNQEDIIDDDYMIGYYACLSNCIRDLKLIKSELDEKEIK